MNSKLCLLAFLLMPIFGFCQIESVPKSYKTIKFVYQKKSNFTLNEKGFYADTTQYKVLFPDFEYEKFVTESGNEIGFTPIAKLTVLQRKTILKKMIEDNVLIYGTVDLKKNKVDFLIHHSTPENDFAHAIFNLPQNKLTSSYSYQYKKKFSLLEIYTNGVIQNVNILNNQITMQDEIANYGQFSVKKGSETFLQVVQFDPKLPALVTPVPIFANVSKGIKSIIGIENHYSLISVSYE